MYRLAIAKQREYEVKWNNNILLPLLFVPSEGVIQQVPFEYAILAMYIIACPVSLFVFCSYFICVLYEKKKRCI